MDVRCPACNSDAFYRYGRTRSGKRRFRCLVCGRQFILGSPGCEVAQRPICPVCGKKMHVYKKEKGILRFRCSGYPECKTFEKIEVEEK